MDAVDGVEQRSAGRGYFVRAVVSLAVGAGILLWLFFALALWALRCGDNCSGNEAEHWRYPVQFVLAATGGLLGMLGLILGFTSKRNAFWIVQVVAASCALVWLVWVQGVGGF